MNGSKSHPSCGRGCCGVSRRLFLGNACAACVGAGGLAGCGLPLSKSVYGEEAPGKPVVRVLFALHAPVQDRPDWPNIGFDFNPVMEKTMNALAAGCPDLVFVPSMAAGPEQAQEIVDKDTAEGKIDAYLVMQMNAWNRVVQSAVETGKPVLFADFLYAGSGGFLVYTASMIRAGKSNFAFMSSGKVDDLVAAARCFALAKKGADGKIDCTPFVDAVTKLRIERTPVVGDMGCTEDKLDLLSIDELFKELKSKKMLEVEKGMADVIPQTKESLGIDIVRIPFAELNAAWEKADRDEAAEIVKRWKSTATSIVGVPDETLEASARMYLAEKACLKKHDACAITVNCLGGFYGKHIHAYPCLGFHELCNEGLIGACECDTLATLTMVVFTALTKGRPGFISDPVMDIASRQIIYAHCVAANKMFGPAGSANPFSILTHSEDRQGASVRSTLPVGYMTTTVVLNPDRKELVFHRAKAVANSTEDRACRTKLVAVPVGDFEKLFREWDRWGWHRVTYYGDLKESILALADRLGWKATEEA